MRFIGILDDERRGHQFSLFLHYKGIPHKMEVLSNSDWESPNYGLSQCFIWIQEEDQVEEAQKWYQLFLKHPNDPIFTPVKIEQPSILPPPLSSFERPSTAQIPPQDTAKESVSTAWNQQRTGIITRLILVICCTFFLLNFYLTPNQTTSMHPPPHVIIFFSPVEKVFLYDYPYTYQLVDRFIKLYGHEDLEDVTAMPTEGRYLLQKIYSTPHWEGIYSLLQKQGIQAVKKSFSQIPMFEKIRAGEWWRLFSPALLHSDALHLLFNMIWLMILGKQLEQRLAVWRYILFILIVGIISNTGQYLMGGPNFIGFSGVLCGMLTFIWMRQRYAPWEGYQLDRMTFLFIFLFILGMAILQIFLFIFGVMTGASLSSGIANAAHLTGAAVGYLLGRLNFFSWRHS